MFDDDSVSIATPPFISSAPLYQKPSSLRPIHEFDLSSSSSKLVDEEIKIEDNAHRNLGSEIEANPPKDNHANNPRPSRTTSQPKGW